MFPIDPTKLPALRTRKAFLVVDPQNDFLDDEGALPINQPLDLPEKIALAVQAFRDSGVDIIWVRTQFDKIRSIHNEMILTADLPLGNGPASSSRSRGSRASQGGGVVSPKCPEGFLSIGANSTLSKAVRPETTGLKFHPEIEKAVSRKDQVLTKSFYSAFKNDQILRLLRMRFVTELYICGSFTNIGVMATAYDAASHGFAITLVKDCCGFRSPARHNAAIKQLVELTGCDVLNLDEIPLSTKTSSPRTSSPKVSGSGPLSSAASSIYPAMFERPGDDSKSGSTSTDLQDALALLSIEDKQSGSSLTQSKQSECDKTSMTANEGPAEGVSHGSDARPDTKRIKDDTVANAATHPIADNESPAPNAQPHSTIGGNNEKNFESSTTADPNIETGEGLQNGALRESDPNAVDASDAQTMQTLIARKAISSSPPTSSDEKVVDSDHDEASNDDTSPVSMATRGDALCEGDSRVVFNILPAPLADDIFEKVREEVQWQRMSHQGGEVPRLVAVQGEVEHDGSMPVYRHPSDESPPLLPFTPTVTAIKEIVEKELGHPLNHALIQFYRHGNDYISEHSDKTLDIAKDSFIANVSLGAERTMVLRTKRTPKPRDNEQEEASENSKSDIPPPPSQPSDLKRKSERAPLPHNSLMKMGLQTNMKWLHGIRQDKRQDREKNKEELAYGGGRISLTFRRIGTFLDAEQRLIWGQGATGKTRDAAQEVINGQTPQAIEMLRAFGRENQLSEFAWDTFYGKGFDVLHITASPRLFLSTDAVTNMRVQMMLAELGIGYARGSMGPAATTSGQDVLGAEALQIKLVDTDAAKSTVQGDIAIMMYLDRVYASGASPPISSATEKASENVEAGATTDTQPASTGKVHVDMGKVYTRFQQALGLQDKVRAIYHRSQSGSAEETESSATKSIKELLAPWDAYVSQGMTTEEGDHFLASTNSLSLADYTFWPVLHDIVARDTAAQARRRSSPVNSADCVKSSVQNSDDEKRQDEEQRDATDVSILDGLSSLKAYYDRVKARESVTKLLAVVGEKKD